jgi:hypothetical protein
LAAAEPVFRLERAYVTALGKWLLIDLRKSGAGHHGRGVCYDDATDDSARSSVGQRPKQYLESCPNA